MFQFGERCGGFANEAGECAGGLGCLIKYRKLIFWRLASNSIFRYNPGVESEHNSTGTCVTEQGAECKVIVITNQRPPF